jgi:hypothetical protein
VNGNERCEAALADQGLRGGFSQAADIAEAEAEGEFGCSLFFTTETQRHRGRIALTWRGAGGLLLSPLRGLNFLWKSYALGFILPLLRS